MLFSYSKSNYGNFNFFIFYCGHFFIISSRLKSKKLYCISFDVLGKH